MTSEQRRAPIISSRADRLDLTETARLEAPDPEAFDVVLEAYRRELHLYCYRLLGSLSEAEDLVQETMLRAWQYSTTFKGQASLRSWLYQIATNACLDALKKRQPRALTLAIAPEADPGLPLAPALGEPMPPAFLLLNSRRYHHLLLSNLATSRFLVI